MRRFLILFLLLLAAGLVAAPDASNRLVIASWNVENLFDTDDDPDNPGDDDFTPRGWTRWTPERYVLKLNHLAEVIASIHPDILCLVEVENRRVLEDLSRVLREEYRVHLPVILHRDGEDRRGIDVAMLARFAPVSTNWLTPVHQQRDLLFAQFVVDGRPITVCANHWKSWVGPHDENVRIRTCEARAAHAEIRRRLEADPSCALVAAGDFNDNVTSDILTNAALFVLGLPADVAPAPAGALYNLSGLLAPAERGTYYYGKDRVWNSFDSMSVSRAMLAGSGHASGWQVVTNGYGPFVLPQQRDAVGHPLPFHRVRRKDANGILRDNYLPGYSDHFPVRCVLQATAP
jgi:endonuclease/exonuclease/phosphatase family metal-dependent hydrolase